MKGEQLSSVCRVRVYLLGPLEVAQRTPLGDWQVVQKSTWGKYGKAGRRILGRLLAAPGRRVGQGRLMDDLWPNTDSKGNLDNGLTALRAVVGKDLIETIDAILYQMVDQSLVWTDVDACTRLLREAENQGRSTEQAIPLLEEALSYLERGEYLEGEEGIWCHSLRKKPEEMLKQCRFWLAQGYEQQDKLWQAGEQYRTLCATMPPNEEALQHWMALLYQRGGSQEALKCYQDVTEMWEAQGYVPSDALQKAVSQTKQPTLALTSPAQLLEDIPDGMENSAEKPGFMNHLRRQITIQGARIALGLTSFPVLSTDLLEKRLLIALRQRPSPDSETVQYLQQRVDHYWEQRQTARLGPVLVPYVAEDLHRVTTFLEGSLITDVRTEFSVIAGNLAMLLGELFFEQNLYHEAREYYKTAAIAAHEANNPQLEAAIYGRRSLTWMYQNQLNAALSCVQHGRTLAAHDDRITIWLTAMEAEIQAKMGNEPGCLASLKCAARLRDFPEQKPFYWIHFDVSLLAGYEGACFLKLGKPVEAHRALTQALMMLDAATNRRKPRLLVDLARAYVQQGEIEAACASLLQATDLLHSIKSPLTQKRLLSLRQELRPWQETTSIQQLDEALYQLTEMR